VEARAAQHGIASGAVTSGQDLRTAPLEQLAQCGRQEGRTHEKAHPAPARRRKLVSSGRSTRTGPYSLS
jgi:hypothetical protein